MTTSLPSSPAQPFLKWAGGKSQLLAQYAGLLPREPSGRYFEPFVGSGAVFFWVQAQGLFRGYHLADLNADLIACYEAVRSHVDALIARLVEHRDRHAADFPAYYYAVRALDRDPAWGTAPLVERAARLIYLNKTCYNGLWRVNSRGHFNVPVGRYANPPILDEARLRAASAALHGVTLAVEDFEAVVHRAAPGDFVYFDPPYMPLSRTANFTSYGPHNFGADEQRALARVFAALDRQGVRVMLSNSDAPEVRALYRGFRVQTVSARRAINSAIGKRGPISEVVITNY